ncbi:hypothetical protein HDU84_004778 [Entophlyctis sp. JEL0112]|nr:hypothetical protein HDU84_004778 [Entophlyctis sp. JEL0112]
MSMPLPLLRILNPLSADLHEHRIDPPRDPPRDSDHSRVRRAVKHRSAPQQQLLQSPLGTPQLHHATSPLNPAHARSAGLPASPAESESASDAARDTRANIAALVAREVNTRLRAIGDALADTLAQEEAHELEMVRRLDDVMFRVAALEASSSLLFKGSGGGGGSNTTIGSDTASARDLTAVSASAVHALHMRLDAIEALVSAHSARIDALEARLGVSAVTLQTTPHSVTPPAVAGITTTAASASASSLATKHAAPFRLASIPASIPNLGISSSLAKLGNRLSLSRSSSRQSDTYVHAPALTTANTGADDLPDAEGMLAGSGGRGGGGGDASSLSSEDTTRTRMVQGDEGDDEKEEEEMEDEDEEDGHK